MATKKKTTGKGSRKKRTPARKGNKKTVAATPAWPPPLEERTPAESRRLVEIAFNKENVAECAKLLRHIETVGTADEAGGYTLPDNCLTRARLAALHVVTINREPNNDGHTVSVFIATRWTPAGAVVVQDDSRAYFGAACYESLERGDGRVRLPRGALEHLKKAAGLRPRHVTVDLERFTVSIDGKNYDVSERCARLVERITSAEGKWLSGSDVREFFGTKENIPRLLTQLPEPVRDLIESQTKGYRLKPVCGSYTDSMQ